MNDPGQRLRNERLKRGLTLRELSDKTLISITVLKSLEEGRPENVGPASVVNGLFKTCSQALGLDPGEVEKPAPEAEPLREPAAPRPKSARPVFFGAAVAFLLAFIFAGIVWKSGWPPGQKPAAPVAVSSTAQTPVETAPGPPAREDAAPVQQTGPAKPISTPSEPPPAAREEPAEPQPPAAGTEAAPMPDPVPQQVAAASAPARDDLIHRLDIQADQQTWIQVTVDGKHTESELLQPGQRREWKARENVRVVVGNGGGVRLKWDGKPVDISREPRRVIRLTLPDAGQAAK